MDPLKAKFKEKAAALAAEVKSMLKEHGEKVIDQVTLSQAYGGMRDIKSMIWETSLLDAQEGIRFRGYSIPELSEKLPKGRGKEPLPEGLFWLMLTDEIPTEEETLWLTNEWEKRRNVPSHVYAAIDALPKETHAMTMFTVGIMALQTESIFAKRYEEGMPKSEYWDVTYEDSMNLIANLPPVAAYIYRRKFKDGQRIEPNTRLDWASNFAHMLGYDDADFKNLMRLYMTIHADHEGGNASAHTTHLVGSTLSDPYLSFAAAMNALAGPLHGLANQEVIKWIFEMVDNLGTTQPTDEQIVEYVKKTLSEGRVVPGYGHAVLRQPDPRFTAQKVFAEQYCQNDDIVKIVWQIFNTVPPILQSLGKIKNPWPNVDAHSGALLVHYGMKEYGFYTVLFGVSRALGVLAAQCWSRALGFPLERPKSLTTELVKEMLANTEAKA
ncbi:putative citrate synthase 1 [Daphnia sinensis]|uniref:Citrate synthase n=1 Tax=Daphnia sinensis TaxID=1820382 RepID=A0AAD5PMC4_9CRUS|nr:putative citrate synthase 1 [Daphnia sinensis]